ncbi:acyl-CoA thioesterase [Roseiterribacter gracilis]|uniref:Thioesterase n=1 Tax=Roseiterribacter gracilis TaxID=2812848 RepID=A0A8S8XE92_9PROT|nr:thioesterase [Rhodospirillales bacterium TMPK1]
MDEPGQTRETYRAFRTIPTRWMDVDVYGHVNNTVYYSWFDTAINAWMVESGVLDPASGEVIGVCAESGCRYLRAVEFPGAIEAGIRVAKLGRSSVRWEIGIFTASEATPAAQGFFVHVFVDRATMRPTDMHDALRAALQSLLV